MPTLQPTKICPCCGHPTGDKLDLVLGPIKRGIFDRVSVAGTKGVHVEQLRTFLYGDDANGGPESPAIIGAHISQLNKKLSAHGLRIKQKNWIYRLYVARQS